jgi:uncharacterized protein
MTRISVGFFLAAACLLLSSHLAVNAQTAPSAQEIAAYKGIHLAAADGSAGAVQSMATAGVDLELRDGNGRTPFLIAAFRGHIRVMETLAAAGADVNALDAQSYDAVTIAAVADDLLTLEAALKLGNKAGNITSPYNGTAVIAAAHLGHAEVVDMLIKAGAPLDHVNNLGWTALIEAVVLGDGGPRHQATVRALVGAGADKSIADKQGLAPLQLAEARGYSEIAALLR